MVLTVSILTGQALLFSNYWIPRGVYLCRIKIITLTFLTRRNAIAPLNEIFRT